MLEYECVGPKLRGSHIPRGVAGTIMPLLFPVWAVVSGMRLIERILSIQPVQQIQ